MSLRDYIAAIVDAIVGRRIDLSRPYRATVVTQHVDGTLDVKPVGNVIPSMTNVPICYGEPGVSAKVKAGAIVFVEFADGDPSKPYVTGWTAGSVDTLTFSADHVRIADGDLALARRGDVVQVNMPIFVGSGSFTPGTVSPITAYGTIMSGSAKATSS